MKIISRREFVKALGLGAAALVAPRLARAEGPARRPNILFLLTDDQRWDAMGCAGNPIIRTPNMDALAREGCRFANAFVTTSICMASRATILTGLYEGTHHYSIQTPALADRFSAMSYPTLLRAAGYRTGFIGKLGVGVSKAARLKMFDVCRAVGRTPYLKRQPDGSLRHETDIDGDEAVAFLRACRPDQPFCLSVSFNAPHAEDNDPRQYFWPPACDGLYKDAVIPVPEPAAPAFFERQPEFLRNSMNRQRWGWRFTTPESTREMLRGYYRMISGVDAVIGRLRDELKRLNLDDNTIIIFSSDNGYFLGDRGFADKWLLYEPSLRVPLIVHDPRADKTGRGVVLEPMALNVDIAPTILDLAGIPAPAGTQGCSLVPLRNSADRPASRPALRPAGRPADRQIPFLKGEKTKWRSDFLCGFWREFRGIPRSEGVRTEQWKYIRYFDQKAAYEELYDLSQDPHEERNLARDPGQAQTLDALRRRCDELLRQYGGVYPVPVTSRQQPGEAGQRSGKMPRPKKQGADDE